MKSARMSVLEFQKYYREDCQSELYYRKENGKYQLNLWRANEIVMEEAGIFAGKHPYDPVVYLLQSGTFVFTPCLKRQTWQSGSVSRTEEERMIL